VLKKKVLPALAGPVRAHAANAVAASQSFARNVVSFQSGRVARSFSRRA
jgi:hypothetical protein